jgi:tripartite-type tricarboxylate transporter receptor subunit TctC
MRIPRRRFLYQVATAAALPAVSCVARAQTYPTRPVRIVVGFAAGGGVDIFARLIGQLLSERLGQPFVIEPRPGAAGNIATEAVVKASPDGYSLLLIAPANTANATLYEKLKFNFIADIVPIAGIFRTPYLVVVNPSLPTKTLPEFIAYAKANRGKLNMASPGNGTPPHLNGELFNMMTGVDLVNIPYRGGYVPGLLGGQVPIGIEALDHFYGPWRDHVGF